MAAQTDVTLTNNDNSRVFLFRGVSFKNRKNQQTIAIPLVNTTSANTVLFRFFGQQRTVTFQFALFDDDTDVSNGTSGTAIKTVPAQIQWLLDSVFTDNYDVSYLLAQGRNFSSPITGVIEDIDIDDKAGAGTVVLGTLTFREGRIGAL